MTRRILTPEIQKNKNLRLLLELWLLSAEGTVRHRLSISPDASVRNAFKTRLFAT